MMSTVSQTGDHPLPHPDPPNLEEKEEEKNEGCPFNPSLLPAHPTLVLVFSSGLCVSAPLREGLFS